MGRQGKSIAGFGDVANTNNANDRANVNDNININDLINVKAKKELVGIYFDDDVRAILSVIKDKGGRGAQSKIVNDAVRKLFEANGYL